MQIDSRVALYHHGLPINAEYRNIQSRLKDAARFHTLEHPIDLIDELRHDIGLVFLVGVALFRHYPV
jgi:hypothetical protein